MRRIRTTEKMRICRCLIFLTGLSLIHLKQNRNNNNVGVNGLYSSSLFLLNVLLVDGFTSPLTKVNSHYHGIFCDCHYARSMIATTRRCLRPKTNEIGNTERDSAMFLADSDNYTINDERRVLETLWSYVDSLQRARKRSGEMKAVYSLVNFLHSKMLKENKIYHMSPISDFHNENKTNNYYEEKGRHIDVSNSTEAKEFLNSLTEVLERALIPAIRQAGESNDYRIIIRLINEGIAFSNSHPILTPRIFGEALNSLSKTDANASKLKSMWNAMIGSIKNSSNTSIHSDKHEIPPFPLFLRSPPTAFELNTFLKSMGAQGKSKACIDIFKTYSSTRLENCSIPYIQPDAYTISILISVLSDSISKDQKMCEPVKFSVSRTKKLSKIRYSVDQQLSMRSGTESLLQRIESLTYSTCWQWNNIVELLGTLDADEDSATSKPPQSQIEWRNNHVYSSLLKLQEKSQDLCNGRINSPGYHKNGPELTTCILDDMIRHEVMPDEVTSTLAIKAMGRAVLSMNKMQTAALHSTQKAISRLHVEENNLAVDFLERMKSDPNLPNPNQYSYSAAINTCARLKDHQTALHLLEEMRNGQSHTTSANNTDFQILDSKRKQNNTIIPPPNTWVYNAALLSLDNKEKNYSKQNSKSWMNKRMKRVWIQHDKEMNQQKRTEIALKLLYQMNDDKKYHDLDTKPDTVTYNTILGIGTFPHDFKTNETLSKTTICALSLIDEMKKAGIARDAITYCNAIDSSVHNKYLPSILRMCLKDTSLKNCKDHEADENAMTAVFNMGLHTLTARQEFSSFKTTLTLMFEHKIPSNDDTLTTLINAVGKYEKGSSLIDLIKLKERVEDKYGGTNSSMHQLLLESIGLIGHIEILYSMPMLGAFHYTQAINICLRENEFTNAYTILSKMRAKGINPTTSCMEGFALAYAQSAVDATVHEKKQKESKDGNNDSVSIARASSAYKIAMALTLPRLSTLGRVARACAMTGQWKLCRALLQSIHNSVLTPKEDGSLDSISPHLLQTIRGTHSYLLRECAKQGSVHAALHYTSDVQEFAKKIRTEIKANGEDIKKEPKFAEIPTDGENIFKNLRDITDTPSPKTNVGMQPNDWISVIQAASKSGHWRVCINTLQFLRPYVERTNLAHEKSKNYNFSDERYNQLTYALYAVTRSLESHSQDAWAVRVIEDWIEWSGRQPRIESLLSAIRVLSTKGRVEEIRQLMATCLDKELPRSITKSKRMSYEEILYVGVVTALHNNGLYDDSDEFFMSGIEEGFLPFNFFKENKQFVLDLHGLNVALAHSVVRIAMRQQAAFLSEDEKSQSNMMIITGKGRNSEFHLRPILRPEVQRMLLEEFYPPLNTMSVPGNMGALIILARDIKAWQEQQEQQKGIRMLKLANVLRNLSSQERLRKIISLKFEPENDSSN